MAEGRNYLRSEQQPYDFPSSSETSQISNLDSLDVQMQNMTIDTAANNVANQLYHQPNQRIENGGNIQDDWIQPIASVPEYNDVAYQPHQEQFDSEIEFLQAVSVVRGILVDESETTTYILDMLIQNFSIPDLDTMADIMLSDEQIFREAAQGERRSTSICYLIRKLKHSPRAYTITSIMAPSFELVGTESGVKKVIKECLNTFGNGPNKILYEQAILHFRTISVYKAGSKLIQEDILNRISGAERVIFLNEVANASNFLVQDPFGNYIVSHVLSLNHAEINNIIYSKLEDMIVFLSRLNSSSHVVEKIIESSETGLRLVVSQITQNLKTIVSLANDRSGNYVVQTALRFSKRRNLHLYIALSTPLRQAKEQLRRSCFGLCVLSTMDELESQQPCSP